MLAKPPRPAAIRPGGTVFWAGWPGPTRPGDSGDVADLCGRTAAGTRSASGCVWSKGAYGPALSFDGSAGYYTSPFAPITTGKITVALLATLTSVADNKYLLSKSNNVGTVGYAVQMLGSTISFFANNGTSNVRTPAVTPTLNVPQLITGVYDGAAASLYLGSSLVGSTASAGTMADSSSYTLTVGAYAGGGFYAPAWTMHGLQIFPSALPASQIKDLASDFWWRLRPPGPRVFLMGIVRPEVVAAIEAGLTAAEMAAALAHGLPAKASPDQAKAFQARLAGG